MQKGSAGVPGLRNSTLYRFLESILEGLKRGDFDDQLKEYQAVEDKLIDRDNSVIMVSDYETRLSKAEIERFYLRSPLQKRSDLGIPLETSNGIALSFFWDYSDKRDFWMRKYKIIMVACRIQVEEKDTLIEVTYATRKNEEKTLSGFTQLKDIWEEICSRCELFEKGGKNDLGDIDKKMQEFSDLQPAPRSERPKDCAGECGATCGKCKACQQARVLKTY